MKYAAKLIINSLYKYKLLDNVIILYNVKVYLALYIK